MSKPKNILFITADQWRGDCLSIMGHPCLETPNLDRLAADGVVFRRHYAQATPCGPSRASLFTGMYLMNHRSVVNGAPLDARHPNVALETREAGYEPVLFGYTDVSADPATYEHDDPALTTYEGLLPGITPVVHLSGGMAPWLAHLEAKGYGRFPSVGAALAAAEVFRPKFPAGGGRGATFAPARYRAEDSHVAFLTDEAIAYIARHQRRPWFVHLSYLAPHPPFIVSEPYHARYDPADAPPPVRAPTPEQEAAQHPWLAHFLYNQRGTGFTFGVTAADHLHISRRDLRQLRATYYGMISEVDAQIGRLVDQLKASGAYDDTLIVFTTDHGEQLGDHWMLHKYGYFDQAFHIPLIVRDPDCQADGARGRIVDAFTESVDVMPTILGWLGLDTPPQCDGLSLVPFCRGEAPSYWRQEAHWEYDFRNIVTQRFESALGLTPDQCSLCVVRGRRYKYVHFTALPALFFDLDRDPHELTDLAGTPSYRHLVMEHAQKMLSWRMNHADRALANTLLTPQGPVTQTGPRW